MKEWRGTIIQLACLASIVMLVSFSKNADPHILTFALGSVGTVLGQSVARARTEATRDGRGGDAPSGASMPPGKLPTIIGGVLGCLIFALLGYDLS